MFDLLVALRWSSSLALAFAGGLLLLQGLSRSNFVPGRVLLCALSGLAAVLAALGIMASAAAVDPDAGRALGESLRLLATETWSGRMMLAKLGLTVAAFVMLLPPARGTRPAAFLTICVSLFLLPFSGHAVTADPVSLSLTLHGLHACAALLWAGAVVCLGIIALRSREEPAHAKELLRAFSPFALLLVVIGGLAGLAAGYLQAGLGAALFGTIYGQLLLLKIAVLFGIAFPCAAWLRWVYLAEADRGKPRLILVLEATACLAMTGIAAFLSQSVPARHDDIIWPLPFRLDWNVLSPDRDGAYVILGHLIFGAVMLTIALAGVGFRKWVLVWITGGMGLLIGSLGLLNLVVPAYPTSYAALDSSFSVETLAGIEPVFLDKCAPCHGETGQGDGPAMLATGRRAADLTAPHAGYHTPGDIYWWITNGFPGSAMPGFEVSTTEQQRWDLVNYLKLIGNAARARDVTNTVTPGQPFLPSIDAGVATSDDGPLRLRDFEDETAMLLVLGGAPGTASRLLQLQDSRELFRQAGLKVVTPLESNREMVAHVWLRYLVTPRHPSPQTEDKSMPHGEFLIDRYGYVRAKWRTDEGPLPSPEQISSMSQSLLSEPRLLRSPEEHLH